MDHAWYARDVAEMQLWRRVGGCAWAFAVAFAVAQAYSAVAHPLATLSRLLSPASWASRCALSLAFAAIQIPVVAVTTALIRPSPGAPRVAGASGVDPWGVFAAPGSDARWAGANAPPHLFPANFAPTPWVPPQIPRPTAREIARDALLQLALLLAHCACGAASAATLGSSSGGLDSSAWSRSLTSGAVLGFAASAHFFLSDAHVVPPPEPPRAGALNARRPLSRLRRLEKMAPGALRDAVEVAAFACVAHATLAVAFAASAIVENAGGPFSAVFRVLARGFLEAYSATFRFPLFASVAFCWRVGSAVASSALAERYRFRPQTLERGAAAAAAPLLASLVMHEAPWVQHCAFEDLCAIAEERGGGTRAASTGRGRGRGRGRAGGAGAEGGGLSGSTAEGSTAGSRASGVSGFAPGAPSRGAAEDAARRALLFAARPDGKGGGAYAPALAAALAPVLAVAAACRAAMEKHLEAVREGGIGIVSGGLRGHPAGFEPRRGGFGIGGGSFLGATGAFASGFDARSRSKFGGVRLRLPTTTKKKERDAAAGGSEKKDAKEDDEPAAAAAAAKGTRDPFSAKETFVTSPTLIRRSAPNGSDPSDPRGGGGGGFLDAVGSRRARAAEAAAADAWGVLADEWGVGSPAANEAAAAGLDGAPRGRANGGGLGPPDSRAPDAGPGPSSSRSRAISLAAEKNASSFPLPPGAASRARAAASAPSSASQLRAQMIGAAEASAEEARDALDAFARLARFGARAAAALASAPAEEDPRGLRAVERPTAAATFNALLAALHATRAVAEAGGEEVVVAPAPAEEETDADEDGEGRGEGRGEGEEGRGEGEEGRGEGEEGRGGFLAAFLSAAAAAAAAAGEKKGFAPLFFSTTETLVRLFSASGRARALGSRPFFFARSFFFGGGGGGGGGDGSALRDAAPVAARIAGDLERAARTMVDALGADACREYVSGKKSAERAAGADSATKRAPFGIAADFEMGREAPEEIARLFERVARGGE